MSKTRAESAENALADAEPNEVSVGWPVERIFAGLLALFGLIFAFVFPPCQVPDEGVHFLRSYSVSLGRLTPKIKIAGYGGDKEPESVSRTILAFHHLWRQPDRKATWDDFGQLMSKSKTDNNRVAESFGAAAMNSFVAYIPSAVGLAIARTAHLNPLALFYAGRLSSLAFSVVLVYFAIRITPYFKHAIGAIALIPVSVQQLASYSPDASVIPASLLLSAVLLRLALGSGPPARGRTIALIFVLTAWIALCKFPYALIILLFAAVPAARIGSRNRFLLIGCGLLAVAVVLVAISTRFSRGYVPDSHFVDGYPASISAQMSFMKLHKFQYMKICIDTCVERGREWIDQLTVLGALDTPLNRTVSYFFSLFLLAIGLLDQPRKTPISARMKLFALLAGVLSFGLILISLYTFHSPIGGPIVLGVQGRYVLPLLPLVLILLNSRSIRIQAEPRALLVFTVSGCVAILIVSVGALLQRYYCADPANLLSHTNTVVTAMLVVGLIVGIFGRRPPVASPSGVPGGSGISSKPLSRAARPPRWSKPPTR